MDQALLFTRVAVVLRQRPILTALTHVLTAIDDFLDVSTSWSLAHAAKFGSLPLLVRVAARQAKEWASLSPLFVKCYRQEQFADAMFIMAEQGFFDGAMWLHDVYFPAGRVGVLANVAAEYGHAKLLAWMIDMFVDERQVMDEDALKSVISYGYVDVIHVMWERNKLAWFTSAQIIDALNVCGHLGMVQFLHQHFPTVSYYGAMCQAAREGSIETILWIHKHIGEPLTPELFQLAVSLGQLELARYLHANHTDIVSVTNGIINRAASNGDLEMLQWLYEHRIEEEYKPYWHGDYQMIIDWPDGKSSDGYWAVCRWLYDHNLASIPQFIQIAAISGNLSMLEWMFDKDKLFVQQNTRLTMTHVALKNHLPILKWLYAHGFQFDCWAMCAAAENGHESTVTWFCDTYPQFRERQILDAAAAGGYLEIVELLYGNGFRSPLGMGLAAINGHLEVVKFLHYNGSQGCRAIDMDNIERIDILDFLHKHRPNDMCTLRACIIAAHRGNLKVLQWLYRHKREVVDLAHVRRIALSARDFPIVYWVDAVDAGLGS